MSLDDTGEIFLEAVELATNMARSISQSPAEISRRSRSRSWIFGQLRKKAEDYGVTEDTIRAIVESLAKAKLSEDIPDLLPGQRDRGLPDSHEESIHPVWAKRAQDFADILHTPRSMFELQALTKRLWDWPGSMVINVAEIAERLELIEYCNPPQWQRKKPDQMSKKPPRTREETVMHMLPVALTEADRVKIMNSRASLLNQRREIEDEKKASLREFGRRLGEVDGQLERADAKVRSGNEIRQVACREIMNFDDATFTVIRLDTADEIEARALTEDERQLTIGDTVLPAPVAAVAAVG